MRTEIETDCMKIHYK